MNPIFKFKKSSDSKDISSSIDKAMNINSSKPRVVKNVPSIHSKKFLLAPMTVIVISLIIVGVVLSFTFDKYQEETRLTSEDEEISIITSSGFTVWDDEDNSMKVHVRRGIGVDVIEALEFTFEYDGKKVVKLVDKVPRVGGTEIYTFDLSELGEKPERIAIAPIYKGGEKGEVTTHVKNIEEGIVEEDEEEIIVVDEDDVVDEEKNSEVEDDVTDTTDQNNETNETQDNETNQTTENEESQPNSISLPDLSDNALVIYNKNHPDAKDIAEYYAEKRNIPNNHLCEIEVPAGQYATLDHLRGARKKIIEDCLCNIYSSIISNCDISKFSELSEVSSLTHLVIIKGIPPRLTGTPYGEDFEEGSFDFFLAHSIYQNLDYLLSIDPKNIPVNYKNSDNNGLNEQTDTRFSYVRELNASIDKSFAYGRVEAITKDRTIDLIDRTIESEKNGLRGKFFSSHINFAHIPDKIIWEIHKDLTSEWEDQCIDYFSTTENWPTNCRTGIAKEGQIPGESSSDIPNPINANNFIGTSYTGNSQRAFDGFVNMIDWHKSTVSCIELCEDFPTQAEIDSCKDSSTDYFKVINTECVGVNEGFMGFQMRSYPVQYYGFWPEGWSGRGAGNFDKTPPFHLEENGNNYLRFGGSGGSSDTCTFENETTMACNEIVAVSLFKRLPYNTNIPLNTNSENLTLRFKFRNDEPKENSRIRAWIQFFLNSNTNTYSGEDYIVSSVYYDINEENLDWQQAEIKFQINDSAGESINNLIFNMESPIANSFSNFIDLDDVGLYDPNDNLLWTNDVSEFNNRDLKTTNDGDYAPNVIDRLGGIGWWGSSSHFESDGNAFQSPQIIMGAYYAGRSIGESILHNSKFSFSGIIYIDPLYNPAGAKIFINNSEGIGTGRISLLGSRLPATAEGLNLTKNQIDDFSYKINAWNGKEDEDDSEFEFSYCIDEDLLNCHNYDTWTNMITSNEAVYEMDVSNDMIPVLNSQNQGSTVYFKLKVWNDNFPEEFITNYARINIV